MSISFLKKTTAIATLTIKQSVRSRLLPIMFILLPAIIIFTAYNIEGDGTAVGQIRIAIKYSLGIVWTIMGIATLWAGCATIAREIEDKQLRLIVVKPVQKYEIWLGRWVGWIIINAILLTISGITLYGTIIHKTNSQNLSSYEKEKLHNTVLVGRRRITPEPENIDDKIEPLLQQLKDTGQIPTDTSDKKAYNLLRKKIIAAKSVVAPAKEKTWHITMPKKISIDKKISLNIKIKSPTHSDKPIAGTLIISTKKSPAPLFEAQIKQKYASTYQTDIPSGILHSGENIAITFKNDSKENSRTVVFTPGKSIELLINENSFANNLLNTLLIMLCFLTALSALGLTSSAIFSFPVATFVAVTIILATIASHYFIFSSAPENAVEHHHHGHEHEKPKPPGVIEKTGEIIIKKVQFIIEPIMNISVLPKISSGILITRHETIRAITLLFILYSMILGIIGSYILTKRELAALN